MHLNFKNQTNQNHSLINSHVFILEIIATSKLKRKLETSSFFRSSRCVVVVVVRLCGGGATVWSVVRRRRRNRTKGTEAEETYSFLESKLRHFYHMEE